MQNSYDATTMPTKGLCTGCCCPVAQAREKTRFFLLSFLAGGIEGTALRAQNRVTT